MKKSMLQHAHTSPHSKHTNSQRIILIFAINLICSKFSSILLITVMSIVCDREAFGWATAKVYTPTTGMHEAHGTVCA